MASQEERQSDRNGGLGGRGKGGKKEAEAAEGERKDGRRKERRGPLRGEKKTMKEGKGDGGH